jgi:hypothetical protein
VPASVRPGRPSGGRPMSDLGLDLIAVALARGSKLPGAEPITTYREDGQTADGAAPKPSEEQRQIAVSRHPMRGEILALPSPLGPLRSRRFNDAPDGTPTHDLLHGKQTQIGRPERRFPCKLSTVPFCGAECGLPGLIASRHGF